MKASYGVNRNSVKRHGIESQQAKISWRNKSGGMARRKSLEMKERKKVTMAAYGNGGNNGGNNEMAAWRRIDGVSGVENMKNGGEE
jgi:hypothetical protein